MQYQIEAKSEEEIKVEEAKKKKAAEDKIKKEAAAKKAEKRFYDVKVSALVPCELVYRIFAESPELALDQIDKQTPKNMKPNIRGKKNIKATVYEAGSSLLKHTKAFRV